MNREEECQNAIHEAWDKAMNTKDRIKRLKKVVDEYTEFKSPLSDLAVTYIDIGDKTNAIRTYQKIVDLKDKFVDVWDNQLGKAYLYTGDYDMAIKTIEGFCGHDYSIGLYLAFAYIKKREKKKFKDQFDKWIAEDLEKSFDYYKYKKVVQLLFNEKESAFIEKSWAQYNKKYSNMEPYQLYCALYKQYHNEMNIDIEDDDSEILPKFNKTKFEELSSEYLYLDRKLMFIDEDYIDREKDIERWQELQDLIFANSIY